MTIKTSTHVLATASMALLLALGACHTDENPAAAGNNPGNPVPLRATATLPGAEGDATVTRTAEGDAGSGTTTRVRIQWNTDDDDPVPVSLLYTPSDPAGSSNADTYSYTLAPADADGTKLILAPADAKQPIVTPGQQASLAIAEVSLPLQTVPSSSATTRAADAIPTGVPVPFSACIAYPAAPATTIGAGGSAHLPLAYTTCALRLVLHLQPDADGSTVTVKSVNCPLTMANPGGTGPADDTDGTTRIPTTTATRPASGTDPAQQTVIFGRLTPRQDLATALSGRPLAILITSGGDALGVSLPPASDITATPEAGQMLTLNVHVSRTVANIKSASIDGFKAGNDAGEDITQGKTLVLNGLDDKDPLWKLCAEGKYTDWIVTGGGKEIFATDGPNAGKTKDAVVLENVRKALEAYTEKVVSPASDGTINLTLPEVVGMPMRDGSNGAFQSYHALRSISAPKATDIGEQAFRGCDDLTSISLPEAKNIGQYAFYYCSTLTSISLPEATDIGGEAFKDCSSLTSISLPEATDIGQFAFEGCSKLTSISLPKAKNIGSQAFSRCSKLIRIEIPSVTTVDYPDGLHTYAFNGFTTAACTLVLNPLLNGGTDTSNTNFAAFDQAANRWKFLNEYWANILFTQPTNP